MIGKIIRWDAVKGFGFIGTGEGPNFIFFGSSLWTPVAFGDEVDFWIGDNPNGSGRQIAVDIAVRRASLDSTLEASSVADQPPPPSAPPPPRLFVGNLPECVSRGELYKSLESFGPILAVWKKPEWCYGFVNFANPGDYTRALRNLENPRIGNREIRFKAADHV